MIDGMSKGESVERHHAVRATRGELSVKHSASTERLRAVFERLDVGMILKDAEGKPLETNPALRRMLGYDEEELRGMVRSDFTVPEDAERDAELYRQLLAGERDSFRKERTRTLVELTVSEVRKLLCLAPNRNDPDCGCCR
jgi:PAS domain S-box-containing protein